MATTPNSPLRAIRAFCIECSGNVRAEVRRCPCQKCQLFPFRMGHRPKGNTDILEDEFGVETGVFSEEMTADTEGGDIGEEEN